MKHAPGAVAPLDPELTEVGDGIGQGTQRRGLLQGSVRPVGELTGHDPFDRLLVAQASRTGLRLLTADHVLLGLGRDFILDASR